MKKHVLWLTSLLTVLLLAPAMRADNQLHDRPQYRLHVGDAIDLNYRLTPEYNQSVTIQPDGYVSLDIAGDVKLEGLTIRQAHDLIVQKVSTRLNQPELSLALTNFQKPYVVVGGEVVQPGRIELREQMTAMQAVLLAGGFRETARDTRIVVFRRINSTSDIGEVRELNLHNIRKTSQLEHDMVLEPGDMILVPVNRLEHFARYMHSASFSSGFYPQNVAW